MEISMPLAIESFSYSWLSSSSCKSPAYNGLEELLREPSCSSYGTPLKEDYYCQNFNFDISITKSSSSPLDVLVHADELFSDGLIKPVFVDPSKLDSFITTPSDSYQTNNKPSSCSFSSASVSPGNAETLRGFVYRWKTSTRRTLRRFSRCVSKLRQKVGVYMSRKCIIDDKEEERQVRSLSCLQEEVSPKSATVNAIGALHDEHENAIYEAVLHCKRSIGTKE